MSVSSAERRRIDLSSKTAILAAGDIAAILLFVSVGEYTHGYNPLVDVGRVAGTFAPFLIGWLLVAGVTGLFASDAPTTLVQSTVVTLLSWLLAVVIAQGLRATSLFHGNAALTFAIVSVGIGGVLLVLWRAAATLTVST